jgi:hypothetical protein
MLAIKVNIGFHFFYAITVNKILQKIKNTEFELYLKQIKMIAVRGISSNFRSTQQLPCNKTKFHVGSKLHQY